MFAYQPVRPSYLIMSIVVKTSKSETHRTENRITLKHVVKSVQISTYERNDLRITLNIVCNLRIGVAQLPISDSSQINRFCGRIPSRIRRVFRLSVEESSR
jgi:hypothetical protein